MAFISTVKLNLISGNKCSKQVKANTRLKQNKTKNKLYIVLPQDNI